MSFILKANSGADDFLANIWAWHPIMELVKQAIPLDKKRFERLSANGCGGELSSDEALAVAAFIDSYLADMPPDGRLLLDGSMTTEQETYDLNRKDWDKNYSARRDLLVRFREFCRVSGGFFVL